ncbi:MAG: methyltransferase domain-containing protein [Gammaproteobacteria bacterium]|nr:methyltransferase domain-containing protein [Gammaproteobacteria bacterium]
MYAATEASAPALRVKDGDIIPVFDRWVGSWRLSLHRRALTTQELEHSYDRAAAKWNRILVRLDYPTAYEALLQELLHQHIVHTKPSPIRALDCGVGTGELSCALARISPRPVWLDAIDISTCMLDQARERMRRAELDASFHQGDARSLPFEDDVFDITMTAHLLEHLSDPRVALTEMVRVTKPGGLVIACMTRRSALGLYIHLKWRTHMVSQTQAERWMRESGLQDACRVSFDHRGALRRRSVACAGIKPILKLNLET